MYKLKFYFNIPVSQVSFVTGKIPELMGVLWLFEYFGLEVNKRAVPLVIVVTVVVLVVIGKFWKLVGLYDTEQYVNAYRNEVSAKQLRAAEIILEWDKTGRFKK